MSMLSKIVVKEISNGKIVTKEIRNEALKYALRPSLKFNSKLTIIVGEKTTTIRQFNLRNPSEFRVIEGVTPFNYGISKTKIQHANISAIKSSNPEHLNWARFYKITILD